MCLHLNPTQYEMKTATEDITVYKFLIKTPKGILKTPYRKKIIKIGKHYDSELKIQDSENCLLMYSFPKVVNEGLHSFQSKYKAHMNIAASTRHVLAECIIPKGSNYYEGMFGYDPCYASNCIYYKELLQ